jgi:hypothetical protein
MVSEFATQFMQARSTHGQPLAVLEILTPEIRPPYRPGLNGNS